MSDDGVVNVEEDGPEIVPEAPPPAAVVAAPETPVPPAEPEDKAAEVDAVEVGGQKYVPLAALKGERRQRQALQEKAAKADQLEAYVADARPYVEFLKNNPDLLKPRPQAPAAPAEPTHDPQAESLAKTLDLYTADGKPDLARANTLQQLITSTAQSIADKAIGPMHERNHQDQSARNYQIALTVKDADGRSPSPESLTQIWRTMPAHQTADPNVASILALTALGLDRVSKKNPPPAPAHAPIVTESPGGSVRRPSLSQLEANIARDRGISESKWQELTKGHVAGRPQTLED